jgi:hypothetical protein
MSWWPFGKGKQQPTPRHEKFADEDSPGRGIIFYPKDNMTLIDIAGGPDKVVSMMEATMTFMLCETERGLFWVVQDDRSKRMVIDRELPMAALFVIDDMYDRSILNERNDSSQH